MRDIRANREFMHRRGGYLTGEQGIRQFLDIGTGIPVSPNVHEIAQGIAPESRVVYADNDPIVLAYARALLTSTPEGKTAYVDADLRGDDTIIDKRQDPGLRQAGRAALVGLLHLVSDEEDPYRIVASLMNAVPPAAT